MNTASLKAAVQLKVATISPCFIAPGKISGTVNAHKSLSKISMTGRAIIVITRFTNFIIIMILFFTVMWGQVAHSL